MDFSIGELSRRAQVKVPTIRYYEQIGLLPAPPRTEGKQRRYDETDVGRLNFIRHARELGFEIDAIRELLDMSAQPDGSCEEADEIARRHLGEVDRRIAKLSALRGELTRMISECGHGRVAECRVIQVLADHDMCEHDRH
ncbi:MerR family transcriptional regulator [Enterovirga sp. CN4-39]|uniref:MerR family transcriptional regulator n=1 Tax=Enterovirga sp. CN4-39 TaxID=3400910 RepID=UPI003C115DDA